MVNSYHSVYPDQKILVEISGFDPSVEDVLKSELSEEQFQQYIDQMEFIPLELVAIHFDDQGQCEAIDFKDISGEKTFYF